MPSHAVPIDYRCPSCGNGGSLDVWIVVDAAERPDLLRAATEGRLTRHRCPACGAAVPLEGSQSLLVLRRDRRPPLLFAGNERQYLASLIYLGFDLHGLDIAVLPLDLMPTAAARDVEDDLEAAAAGRFPALTPETQHYLDWLRHQLDARWRAETQPIVLRLLEAASHAELRQLVLEHPALLSDRIDVLFGRMVEEAGQAGQPEMADHARRLRLMLRDCRARGVDAVLPPLSTEPPPPARAEPPDGPALGGYVGAALVGLAGYPVDGEEAPPDPERLRDLLEHALLDITPDERRLHLEYDHGELIGLGDLFALELGNRLLNDPRGRDDLAEGVRLLEGLDHVRASAPRTWAMATHNAGYGAALLAGPGDLEALDRARRCFERAFEVRGREASPDDWALTTVALANVLIQDYPSHLPGYLEQAREMLEDALARPPQGLSPRLRRGLTMTLATALLRRAERTNDTAALTRSTDLLSRMRAEAVEAGDAELFTKAGANLGFALSQRAERTGDPDHWRQAVEVLRETRDAMPPDADGSIELAGNLGGALRHAGEVEAAIEVLEDAIGRAAPGQLWAGLQNNLGNALLDRLEGDRDENLDRAIAAYEAARRVWTKEAFALEWALTTARLGVAHGELPAGDGRAGELLREAAEALSPEVHPVARARVLNRLATHQDPATAIGTFAEAARVLTRAEYPFEWAGIQHNTGLAFRELARRGGAPSDLARAVACFRAAMSVRPVEHAPVEWAETAWMLSEVLEELGDVSAAIDYCGRALSVLRGGAPGRRVCGVAGRLGNLLAEEGRWAEAAEVFEEALGAAERMYATSLLRGTRQRTLGENAWLALAAAHCLIQVGRPEEAVTRLERGRGRLLADALARDPAMAAGADPGSAEYAEYAAAARDLARAEAAATRLMIAGPGEPYVRRTEEAVRAEIRRAAAAFEAARTALPSEGTRPVPPPGHAVLYLFATGRDAGALLVAGGEVEYVPGTPGVVHHEVLRGFVHGDEARPGLLRAQTGAPGALSRELAECLAAVGAGVMAGVAGVLRRRGIDAVTVVPCGLFSAIPVHAAPYDGDRCLIDEVAVSYAPSMEVLTAALRLARARAGTDRTGVAVVDPDGGLPHAEYEAAQLLARVGGSRSSGPAGPAGLAGLATATHVHFACHGESVVDDPLRSHLALGGGERLDLLGLLAPEGTLTQEGAPGPETLLGRARLVVASACQTAVVETRSAPEEFIGLPAGFLAAGVPCFLGTLWPTRDVPSALLITRFYELLFDEGRPADEAVRRAQTWLRDLDGAGLLGYLRDRPDLAEVCGTQARFAARHPDRRFYADPIDWSPYVLIGAAHREAAPGEGD